MQVKVEVSPGGGPKQRADLGRVIKLLRDVDTRAMWCSSTRRLKIRRRRCRSICSSCAVALFDNARRRADGSNAIEKRAIFYRPLVPLLEFEREGIDLTALAGHSQTTLTCLSFGVGHGGSIVQIDRQLCAVALEPVSSGRSPGH